MTVKPIDLFASSVYRHPRTLRAGTAPLRGLDPWGFANHQPVSVTASAVRALVLGGPTASDVWQSLAWAAGIVAVFAPLAVWRYRRV
jgi:hypothetical protein